MTHLAKDVELEFYGVWDPLQDAVPDWGVTVLTVAYGINDIGWGTKADAEHEKAYPDGIEQIIKAAEASVVELQRNMAKPVPVDFAVEKAAPTEDGKQGTSPASDFG